MNERALYLKHQLGLQPLEGEGGYFRKVYTHRRGSEVLGGTIYYLITEESFSSLHYLPTDEVWYFLEGDTLDQLVLYPDGRHTLSKLGYAQGECKPICIVPGGCWQGTKLSNGGSYALCSTTMVPPYDHSRYQQGQRDLVQLFPDCPFVSDFLSKEVR